MSVHQKVLSALAGFGLAASPAWAVNLLNNGSFEVSPPNLFWAGSLDINSTIHQPNGPTPDGVNFGSVQAGGADIVRLANHQPVATSGVGAKNVTLTGSWGGGTTCVGPNSGNPCGNLVKRTAVVRIHDGNANGTVVAVESKVMDSGIGDDPNLPSGFDWTVFSLPGTVSSGQATVEFGWIDGNGQWSDGTGVHADKLSLDEGQVVQQVQLTSASSERTHGPAGQNSIDVNINPAPGQATVEPRQATPIASNSASKMILAFSGVPIANSGTFNCGNEVVVTNGACIGVSVSGNTLSVTMDFNKNACVSVTLSGMNLQTGTPNKVSVRTIEGDVGQNGAVNLVDMNAVKGALFQGVNILNFLNDVNCNGGSINLVDMNVVKGNLFPAVPACP